MRPPFSLRRALPCGLVLAWAFALSGCHRVEAPTTYVHQDRIMPPKTVLFSTMMSDLSGQPGFTNQLMAALEKKSKVGAAVFSPKLLGALRVSITGRDWQTLDRFPGWEMADINPVIDLSGELDQSVAEAPAQPLSAYIDLGDYALDREHGVDLDLPSTLPGLSTDGLVTPLGEGVMHGDGANPEIAEMHSESMRLAEVLNRLSLNQLEGAAPMTVTLSGNRAKTPEDLVRALIATGHQVTVADARYFANFGHLHYEGMDVMMPFWVNAMVWIPGTDRQLKVPVAHAEYEWLVRGPKINADVSFYFDIDGKAEFRTMDTLDQAWVMGRHAHEYQGADAVEVTRLTGLLTLAYAHAHLAHPRLAFGGYYALGVCQDGVAAIEKKMTGTTTLFPNTADMALFTDSRDAEMNGLLAAIPKDRAGGNPQMERIFGSLPTTNIGSISIPGLASDLESVQKAWHDGTLRYHKRPLWQTVLARVLGVGVGILLGWAFIRARARRRSSKT
jgi:hypothetical protein